MDQTAIAEVDKSLSPEKVVEIFRDHKDEIAKHLKEKPNENIIGLTFCSSHALLRRLNKTFKPDDQEFLSFRTVEDAQEMTGFFRGVNACKDKNMIGLLICSMLPLQILGLGPDKELTYTLTTIRLISFLE